MSKFLIPNKHAGDTHDGRRLYNSGGGSGGSGEREATPEEKRLWAAQAASLEGLNQIAVPNLETGMNNLGAMTNEAMDGTLGNRLRTQALNDVNVSLGTSANDVLRSMGGYGTNFNPNRAADTAMQWGLGAAKQRAGAANMATMGAEDLKWGRNAALTGLASGQGAQAVSGMGNLASQITADRNNANNMAMQQQSSNMQGLVGLGSIGAYMMKKDGGEVRLADGGGLRPYKPVSIKLSPWSFQDSGTPAQPDSGMMQTVAGVATPIMGTKMAADGLAKIGIGAPKKAIDAAGNALLEAGKGVVDDLAFAGKDAIASVTGSTLPSAAASNGVQAIGELGTLAGDSLAATAGSELAGSTMSGALGAAAPWLVGGYALGSMLDMWADGGPVPKEGGLRRKDMTKGGKVNGPGNSVSDSIPARLSDGEYVLNTEAVKMIGKQKLDALNNAGLRKRYGKDAPKSESYVQGAGEQKFGMGGLAALGHIARGFVPTAMQLDQQKKMDERLERQDARTAAMHGVVMEDRADKKVKEAKVAEIMGNWSGRMRQMGEAMQALQSGQLSSHDFATAVGPEYSRLIQDGKILQPLADGSFALTEGSGPKANMTKLSADDAAKYLASPEMFMKARRQMYEELAAVDPRYAAQADAMLGKEIDMQHDDRNFNYRKGRDAVSDNQFDMRMKQSDAHHAASMGLNWAQFNLGKENRDYARAKDNEKSVAAMGLAREIGATPAYLEAVRTGVVPPVPKASAANNLKATDAKTVLGEMYGTKNALGEFQFKPEEREKYLKSLVIADRYIKNGVPVAEAAQAAYREVSGGAENTGANPKITIRKLPSEAPVRAISPPR